jgi:hypothetical protein
MKQRTLIGAAAFSAALAGGGLAGAVLGTPGVSGAQDDTTSTTTADTSDSARRHRHHPRLHALQAAAEALGMTPAELKTELEAGKSIADVADEKGVDQQVVVDAIVADGTERLEQAIEELPTRAAEVVEREGLPERPKDGRGHGPRPAEADGEDAPAES